MRRSDTYTHVLITSRALYKEKKKDFYSIYPYVDVHVQKRMDAMGDGNRMRIREISRENCGENL